VTDRFKDILTIYFAFFVTESARYTIMLLAIIFGSRGLGYIFAFLSLNDLLWVTALVIVHIYRFQESGKYCSGDDYREQGYSES